MRDDWIIVKLGDFAFHAKGKKPKRQTPIKDNIFKYIYVDIEAFEKGVIKSYTDGYKCNFCSESDFLMVWDGSRSGLVGKGISGALGSTLVRINFPDIENDFAFYFLQSKFQQINTRAKGTGTPHVDPNLLWNYDFPIPPLPEQRAIVAKIEQLFSDLDNGIANLKTAKEKLSIYRQSVLKKAFEGELTNKTPKKTVKKKLPKDWKWIKSGELFSFITSGSRGWAKYYSSEGSIFIRITNMNFNTLDLDLRESKIQYVNPPLNSEGLRTKIQEGDFLFSITGYLGMFAIAPNLHDAYVNQHVSLCRPKDGFNKKYVGYWIISKTGGHYYLNKNQKGAVKAGLNLDDLKSFPVPICSLQEQNQIVQEIESRLSVCDKLEESIDTSLQQAEALRQSILKRAFEGKLLTDAELTACRQEPDWEPAKKLLERIKK